MMTTFRPLVAACEAFAFPSIKEGFGLAAMEALAAERPVVTRDLPVLREVFGDTVQYAADPSTMAVAMENALRDRSRASAGRELARSRTWKAAAYAHVKFYEAHPLTAG